MRGPEYHPNKQHPTVLNANTGNFGPSEQQAAEMRTSHTGRYNNQLSHIENPAQVKPKSSDNRSISVDPDTIRNNFAREAEKYVSSIVKTPAITGNPEQDK